MLFTILFIYPEIFCRQPEIFTQSTYADVVSAPQIAVVQGEALTLLKFANPFSRFKVAYDGLDSVQNLIDLEPKNIGIGSEF